MISPESWNGLQKRQTGDKNRSYPTWEKSLQDHQCLCLKCFCATLENSLQDHLGVWRAQAGYLGWVQARYWSNSGAGWQDPNNPQQGIYQSMFITSNKQKKELIIYTGRHDDPPTADEGLRGPSLVLVKDLRQSWGRGNHVLFVHSCRALAPITKRRKRYWLIVCFRSAECTLEVSGASPSDMLPIENCLKLSRF